MNTVKQIVCHYRGHDRRWQDGRPTVFDIGNGSELPPCVRCGAPSEWSPGISEIVNKLDFAPSALADFMKNLEAPDTTATWTNNLTCTHCRRPISEDDDSITDLNPTRTYHARCYDKAHGAK